MIANINVGDLKEALDKLPDDMIVFALEPTRNGADVKICNAVHTHSVGACHFDKEFVDKYPYKNGECVFGVLLTHFTPGVYDTK